MGRKRPPPGARGGAGAGRECVSGERGGGSKETAGGANESAAARAPLGEELGIEELQPIEE